MQRPDLVVLSELTRLTWSIRRESFGSSDCARVEGDFPVGTYYTLHLDVVTANIGQKDLIRGNPASYLDPNQDGDTRDSLVYWSNCHKHYHAKHYTTYELLPVLSNGALGAPVLGIKQGSCLEDNYTYLAPPGSAQFRDCKFQGLSVGWGDLYHKNLDGQFFILGPTSGTPAVGSAEPALLEPGEYVIRLTVNPGYLAGPGESCPNKDGLDRCRVFAESRYANNVTKIKITIPDFRQIPIPANQEWIRGAFQCSYGTDDSPPEGWRPFLSSGLAPDDPRLDGKGCPPPDPVVPPTLNAQAALSKTLSSFQTIAKPSGRWQPSSAKSH